MGLRENHMPDGGQAARHTSSRQRAFPHTTASTLDLSRKSLRIPSCWSKAEHNNHERAVVTAHCGRSAAPNGERVSKSAAPLAGLERPRGLQHLPRRGRADVGVATSDSSPLRLVTGDLRPLRWPGQSIAAGAYGRLSA